MHISFVILHYMTIEDTIQCIESIKNNVVYRDYSIILVDNASPNNTGEELKKIYKDDKDITVLINKENLGFAKGNNVGFKYAKYQNKADFIIMINNDTIINQKEFCINIIDEYNCNGYDVAGPNIISLIDNQHQNPVPVQMSTVSDVKHRILKFYILLFLNYIKCDSIIQKIMLKIKRDKKVNKVMNDYQLHGSCLIFSKKYIEMFEGLYSETFMYCEEDILKYICSIENLVMKYLPNIEIYHKEDSSTNEVFKKDILKRRFYYKNSIESCKKLKKLMEGYSW